MKFIGLLLLSGSVFGYNLTRLDNSFVGGFFNLNHITGVLVKDNVVYAPNYGYFSAQQLDPGDPSSFTANTNYTTHGSGDQFNITLHKQSVIVSSRVGGAVIYDISQELAISPLPKYKLVAPNTSIESGIATPDNIFYAAGHSQGIVVFDMSDLYGAGGSLVNEGAMQVVDNHVMMVEGPKDAWALALLGNYMYVADGPNGLAILTLDNPLSPVYLKTISTGSGGVVDVTINGTSLILSAQGQGVLVYDLSDRENPEFLGEYNTSGNAIHAVADDERIYVADMDDLEVIDYTDPGQMSLVGRHRLIERAMGITLANGLIYVAAWGQVEIFRWEHLDGPSAFFDHMRAFDFPRTPVGSSVTKNVGLWNHGNAPLKVSDVTFDGTEFTTEDNSFVVPSGQKADIRVTYTPVDGAPPYTEVHGSLTSDDPVNPTIPLVLVGNKPRSVVMAGDVAPDFTLPMLDPAGSSFSLGGQRGKKHIILSFFAPW